MQSFPRSVNNLKEREARHLNALRYDIPKGPYEGKNHSVRIVPLQFYISDPSNDIYSVQYNLTRVNNADEGE